MTEKQTKSGQRKNKGTFLKTQKHRHILTRTDAHIDRDTDTQAHVRAHRHRVTRRILTINNTSKNIICRQ